MQIDQIHLRVLRNGIEKTIIFTPNQDENGTAGVYALETLISGGSLFEIAYEPEGDEVLLQCQIHGRDHFTDTSLLANGYQSWSISPECNHKSRIHQVNFLIRPLLGKYGDTCFHLPYKQRGIIHSHAYLRIRRPDASTTLIASVDDSAGYTIFTADMNSQRLLISKDCEGHHIHTRTRLFAIYETHGSELQTHSRWQSFFSSSRKGIGACTGWTSWYYYYTGITEQALLDVLENYRQENIPLDIFQIDDGYQAHIGDWLIPNEKFPSGMHAMASHIKAAGYRPGIWLAPFIAERNSTLVKLHPEWILRDEKGRRVHAGINPGWSYHFYAMDIYHEGFRAYLKTVFHTVLHEWGYDLVKLDFLYGAAVIPHHGKSRGAVMRDAMLFLDEIIGNKMILACGVPTAAVFGRCDYCRIGADVSPYWEDKKLAALHYRERVSTLASLKNTISRYAWNGQAFFNDPDVFILRDKNNKLTDIERYTLLLVNNLLGSLVFTSDRIDEYNQEQRELYLSIFPKINPIVLSIETTNDKTIISYQQNSRYYISHINLTDKPWKTVLPNQICFSQQHGLFKGGDDFVVAPHEATCFLLSSDNDNILGSTGYLLPGADISTVVIEPGSIRFEPIHGLLQAGTVWVRISHNEEEMFINDALHINYEQHGIRYAKVIRPSTHK